LNTIDHTAGDGGWHGGRGAAKGAPRPRLHRSGSDNAFYGFTALCAAGVVVLMGAIAWVLVRDAWPSIHKFGISFLWQSVWDTNKGSYGGLTPIYGTVATTVIAIVIAVPLALAIALLLVELVHPLLRKIVGTAIELLAAIPSIVYGMWGLFVLVPLVQKYVQPAIEHTPLGKLPLFTGPPLGLGILTAGLILSLMILPFIAAVSRDVLTMVPQVVKEAGYGMGSTTWEVTRKVSLRYGLSGIVGAFFLGVGRAVGETMAVTYVIGGASSFSASWLQPGQTIASKIALGFPEAGAGVQRGALVELGLILFAMTIIFQLIAQTWLRRVRKRVGGRA
jgi:phosphate transport system permease protein